MTKVGIVSLLAIALTAASSDPPSKAKTHGYALSGTVTGVEEARKTFTVKSATGKSTSLVWTSATTVVGGKLKVGEKVTLRYLDKDGKHIATSVSVGEPAAAATPSPSASPTPAH